MKKPKSEEFIEKVLKRRLVLDLGGGTPWISGWIHKKYGDRLKQNGYCVDFMEEKTPHVVGDIRRLPFKDNSVPGMVCNAVLEHVDKPFNAMEELLRVLAKDGELAFYVPWIWEYHAAPGDYFRYTEDGIRSLTEKFSDVQIASTDFHGMRPNRVFCALHLLLPSVTMNNPTLFKLIAIPIYLFFRFLSYFIMFFNGNREHKKLTERVDSFFFENWTHGYWCLCSK